MGEEQRTAINESVPEPADYPGSADPTDGSVIPIYADPEGAHPLSRPGHMSSCWMTRFGSRPVPRPTMWSSR